MNGVKQRGGSRCIPSDILEPLLITGTWCRSTVSGWDCTGGGLPTISPTEFWRGARYYQGTFSPTQQERRENGYSLAWMHHKGRNRHHFEYWTDVSPVTHQYEPLEMPTEFFVEMCMDRIAASRTYLGDQYHDGAPLEYLQRAGDNRWMHPVTARKLRFILTMLRDKGEEKTFRFIREVVLQELPFAEDDMEQ